MAKKTALVAGATGVIGRYLVSHLKNLEDWDVIGVSRRKPEKSDGVRYIEADLLQPEELSKKFSGLDQVTHIIYAAYQDYESDPEQQVSINLAMFRNVLNAVEQASPALERVLLMQGVKAYGVHLGPFKTPAQETDPRHMPPNFYYDQEDYMREEQKRKSWSWTILRPDVVCGFSLGNPMNIAMVIGTYASISKELGLPLRFPGKAYPYLAQVTDAGLLARCTAWAATEEKCAFEIFNVTNGDFFRWKNLWPIIADRFQMRITSPQPIPLAQIMADKQPLWSRIVDKYRLRPIPYKKLASWGFGDFIFKCDYDVMSDTTKLRKFGFHEVESSEEMFLRLFDEFKEEKVLPF